jgi:hypothetical protein
MIPLYRDAGFTFHFADNRTIPRFHLEGVAQGCGVSVFKIDPVTGKHHKLLATAVVGEEGWVNLAEPIVMYAGEAFLAVVARG